MAKSDSLYWNLFKHRERENVSPLENFLTEALADVLNRLPRGIATQFVSVNFLPHEANPHWLNSNTKDKAWRWTTQVRVSLGGRTQIPDLTLEIGGRPTMIIEVKVDAPLGKGYPAPNPDSSSNKMVQRIGSESTTKTITAAADQLERYEHWLASQLEDVRQGALVLLTRTTKPPKRLLKSPRSEQGLFQRHCQWQQIWHWLQNLPPANDQPDDHPSSVWRILCGELATFIKDNNMVSEAMTQQDLAAAEVHVSGAQRIETTFNRIGSAVKAELAGLLVQGSPNFQFNSEGGVVEGWLYLKAPQRNWYIAWGIRFPSISSWWTDVNPPLPEVTHAFVCLHNQSGPPPSAKRLDQEDILQSWTIVEDNELVAAKPLHDFSADPEQRTASMADWVCMCIAEIKPYFNKLAPG